MVEESQKEKQGKIECVRLREQHSGGKEKCANKRPRGKGGGGEDVRGGVSG